MVYKIAVLAFVMIYFGVILGFRSYLLYKETGINPFQKMGEEGVVGFNEKVMSFCTVLMLIIALNYAFLEGNYQYLIPIKYLEINVIKNIGIVMGGLGLLLTFIAQLQMKNSWRIGIDENEKTSLVTTGMYRYSRNPIYLWLLIAFVGFFLIVPNAVSLCFLMLMISSIGVKVRLEEAYLRKKSPKEFDLYSSKVRRWI